MFERIRSDIRIFKERDPATESTAEILLCYPGLHAIWAHRISNRLYRANRRTMARLVNRFSHLLTGIDIHPGATIGEGFFIDHGTGIVIGETSEIGKNVSMYQGSTLGGTGKDSGKRHPTIGDNVTISTGASVLGAR
jgi:serine O-acetyltransferase